MKIDLLNLEPQKINRSLKGKYIFAYGQEKIGKTTLISSFPRSLILSFEPGANALDGVFVQQIDSWADFKIAIKQLQNSKVKDRYDFIGIDTVDVAYELCEEYICQQNMVENIKDIPWGQGHAMLKKEFGKAFRTIAKAGYGLIFISHAAEQTNKDYRGEEYAKIIPAAPNKARDIVNKLVDFIIYVGMEYDDEHPEGIRKMYMKGTKYITAGSRFPNVPEKTNFGYEELKDAVLNAIDSQMKGKENLITDENNSFYGTEREDIPFDELMEECKTLWYDILDTANGNEEEESKLLDKMEAIIVESFGSSIKLSEVSERQKNLVKLVVSDLKDLKEKL